MRCVFFGVFWVFSWGNFTLYVGLLGCVCASSLLSLHDFIIIVRLKQLEKGSICFFTQPVLLLKIVADGPCIILVRHLNPDHLVFRNLNINIKQFNSFLSSFVKVAGLVLLCWLSPWPWRQLKPWWFRLPRTPLCFQSFRPRLCIEQKWLHISETLLSEVLIKEFWPSNIILHFFLNFSCLYSEPHSLNWIVEASRWWLIHHLRWFVDHGSKSTLLELFKHSEFAGWNRRWFIVTCVFG